MKEKLLELENSGQYVFHGTANPNIKIFQPRQAHTFRDKVGYPDGEPGVFASEKVDYAILKALVNRKNCPAGYTSSAYLEDGKLKITVTKQGYEQLNHNSYGFVYVFNRFDFTPREHGHTEFISHKAVKPIGVIKVTKSDLPEYLEVV